MHDGEQQYRAVRRTIEEAVDLEGGQHEGVGQEAHGHVLQPQDGAGEYRHDADPREERHLQGAAR